MLSSMDDICSGCLQVIDYSSCYCGEDIDHSSFYLGHAPTPIGCICNTLPIETIVKNRKAMADRATLTKRNSN